MEIFKYVILRVLLGLGSLIFVVQFLRTGELIYGVLSTQNMILWELLDVEESLSGPFVGTATFNIDCPGKPVLAQEANPKVG